MPAVLSHRPPTFQRRALIRSAALLAGLVVIGVVAFAVSLRLTAIDAGRRAPFRLPPASSASAASVPLTDTGRDDLGRVVTIEADRLNEEALGTGWLFDARGDFVTNAHVVEGALAVRIADRRAHTYGAAVVGIDPADDIALVRAVDGFVGTPLPVDRGALPTLPVPVVTLASSRATGHGDLSLGEIDATGEDVPLEPGEVQPGSSAPSVYHDMLGITGSQVYQGNSGGPVIDADGDVVGIITLATPGQPQSYAIPITRVVAELSGFAAHVG